MRVSLLSLALVLCAAGVSAQVRDSKGGTSDPQHVICDSGCGSGGVGASVDISSIAGNVIVGANVPVTVASGSVTFTNTTLAVTNAGTFATQATLAAETTKIIGTVNIAAAQSLAISGSVAVTGPLTDTQLRATPVPVSGTVTTGGLTDTQLRASSVGVSLAAETTKVIGTVNQGTSPWVSNVSQFGGSSVALGQGTSAASIPVVLASNALPPPDRATTGTIASNGALVAVTSGGTGTTTVAITGTWVGTFVPFGIDGAGAAQALYGLNALTGQPDNTITGNGVWTLPAAGWSSVGLLSTSWTSGTASIGLIAGVQSNVMALGRSLPTGLNSIGQVTANAGSNLNTSLLALETTQQTGNSYLNVLANARNGPPLPLFPCNAVRQTKCQPKGY